MEKWIEMGESGIDPAREKEHANWYLNVHLPAILETPGFVRVARYVNKEFRDGRGQQLGISEIETDDIDKTREIRRERKDIEAKDGRGGGFGSIAVWRNILYKQIAEVSSSDSSKKKETWINLFESNCERSREDEYNDWYIKKHLPNSLQTPGIMATRLYVGKGFQNGRGKYLSIYEIETDDIEKFMENWLGKRGWITNDGRVGGIGIPVWRDVLYKQIAEGRKK